MHLDELYFTHKASSHQITSEMLTICNIFIGGSDGVLLVGGIIRLAGVLLIGGSEEYWLTVSVA